MSEKMEKPKKVKTKKKQTIKLVLLCVLVVILIPIIAVLIYSGVTLGKIHREPLDKEQLGINTDLDDKTLDTMEGYTNIAIFGLDNRKIGEYGGGNSDVIMIASINKKTKDVKLVSVYRDTYMDLGEDLDGMNKCNAAYAKAGAQAAVRMLNTNLDLAITDFVAVDWNAVTNIIDEVGGIELEITKEEIKELNKRIAETNKKLGKDSPEIDETGKQLLDGVQVTAYCRIRHIAGDDFRRASRHRIVLEQTLKKVKKESIPTILGMVNSLAGDISTSLSNDEMISLASAAADYNIVKTSGFPFVLTTKNMKKCGSTMIPLGHSKNVTRLHEFLFENAKYTPSSVVQSINDKIIEDTGIDENSKTDFDMSQYDDTVDKDNAFD